tara:strand:+ start:483 stop:1376 length:894 start_codon:yes stop_codon:yes gene_type:complete
LILPSKNRLMKYNFIFKKVAIVSCLFFITFSCSNKSSYKVKGVINGIYPDRMKMLIDHDTIPGFMEPMEMEFNIHSSVNLEKFNLKDSVHFLLTLEDKKHFSSSFSIVGKSLKNKKNEDNTWEKDIYDPIEIGDTISDASFFNTSNDLLSISDSNGKIRLISYIFSKCPMPDMCPAIVYKNQYLANYFKENNNIEFILISFDYLYDSPNVLKNIYGIMEKENSNLKFFSSKGRVNDLYLITKQSMCEFWGVEENNIGHTMRSILIGPSGQLLHAYDGTDWEPSIVRQDINNMIKMYY